MVFQINCILQFLRATHFTTIPEQKNVTIFKYLWTINHEANKTVRANSNCHAAAQIKLFVM